jgi:hypothetical protein
MPQMIQIDFDKKRNLRFDINAIADLEEVTGTSVQQLMDAKKIGFRIIRAMVWAGLKHEDSMLSLNDAGELVQKCIEGGGSMNVIMEKVTKSIIASGLFGGTKGNPQAGETA